MIPVPAASIPDVMREQLEYLIEHVSSGCYGCSMCRLYVTVCASLLGLFREPSLMLTAKGGI